MLRKSNEHLRQDYLELEDKKYILWRGNNFLVSGKQNLLLPFNNKIGSPFPGKVCYKPWTCIYAWVGGLESASATFPLCLDQFFRTQDWKIEFIFWPYKYWNAVFNRTCDLLHPFPSPTGLRVSALSNVSGFFQEDWKGSPHGGTQVHTKELLGKRRWVSRLASLTRAGQKPNCSSETFGKKLGPKEAEDSRILRNKSTQKKLKNPEHSRRGGRRAPHQPGLFCFVKPLF